MATTTRCRRVTRRYAIPENDTARVEFDYPNPNGRPCSLPLVDVSISGLSFRCRDELPGIDSGTSIASVTVRLGACEMHGEMLVMHATPRSGGPTLVGALFYPAQDVDLEKWKGVLAGIEAMQSG